MGEACLRVVLGVIENLVLLVLLGTSYINRSANRMFSPKERQSRITGNRYKYGSYTGLQMIGQKP